GNGSEYKIKSIIDGTSTTIIFSERCAIPGDGSQYVDLINGGVCGDGVDLKEERPDACLRRRGTNGRYVNSVLPKGGSGTNFAYYTFQNGFFHTIIAPNGPSCTKTDANRIGTESAIFPPTSFHPGGVNACMADGAGRFILNNINTGDLSKTLPSKKYMADEYNYFNNPYSTFPSFNSPYGVWGALGSMNGREYTRPL
ncbi:MAG: DUF1559 domain-containing protein, partial [Planctomycetaceae bacterium]|nr:DUF1559 domain-containing protein [Planctomycetaceae bacterium]